MQALTMVVQDRVRGLLANFEDLPESTELT